MAAIEYVPSTGIKRSVLPASSGVQPYVPGQPTPAQPPIFSAPVKTPAENPIKAGATAVVGDIFKDFHNAGQEVAANADQYAAAPKDSMLDRAKKLGLNVLHNIGAISGGVAGAFAEPVKKVIGVAADKLSETAPIKAAAGSEAVDHSALLTSHIEGKLSEWAAQHPEAARSIGDVGNLAQFLALGLIKSPNVQDVPGMVVDSTKKVVDTIVGDTTSKINDVVGNISAARAIKADAAAVQNNINAVDPELSGKRLQHAYKQVVSGGREVKNPGIFKEQGLTPDERTINLGSRLSEEIPLTNDQPIAPVKLTAKSANNITHLGEALQSTEEKLTKALAGDPEINYNADKPTLFNALDAAKNQPPREFRIGDAKKAVEDVFDFANEVAKNSEDSISGIREARSSFDAQAKTQYPNAFKDGTIDVKTPAGYAIKKARDVFNEHLYNTAPNGSDIKALIGREADIFRATDVVASKAANLDGLRRLEQLAARHPTLARYIKNGLYLYGGYELAKQGISHLP